MLHLTQTLPKSDEEMMLRRELTLKRFKGTLPPTESSAAQCALLAYLQTWDSFLTTMYVSGHQEAMMVNCRRPF